MACNAHLVPKEGEMRSKLDVYRAYNEASWANPPSSFLEADMTYLSDDFQNLDKDGNLLMNREMYTGMGQLLYAAFKDLKFVISDLKEVGEGVIVTGHFEGIHTSDLDLSGMGLGIIPASGKKVMWPDSSNLFKIVGEKIVSIEAYGDSGGVESFLAALGIKAPAA
jgi:predicted ester cyclase